MRKLLPVSLLLAALFLAACGSGERRAPVIGEAYAGPATLSLRQDIPLRSPVVATVRHGDRLEIVGRRRRFMKVRTARGAEGWTEDYLLLTRGEIAALKAVERRALTMPSQGAASTYEVLNVHIEPNRYSPSFFQVRKGERVDVLARIMAPRTEPKRVPLIPPRPPAPVLEHKRIAPAIPPPPPPGLPANWKELSRTPPDVQQAIAASQAAQPTDDWSLVRNAKGQSGWVLRRGLYMAIPDEVAQYAEGHRITSYFPLGVVEDGDLKKNDWLWTTSGNDKQPYDFDSFRVFVWSLRHHRFETAYIQRNVQGYFPVLTTGSGFSVCVENSDGQRVRRTYAFVVNRVSLTAEQPCESPGSLALGQEIAESRSQPDTSAAPPPRHRSPYARLKALARRLFRR